MTGRIQILFPVLAILACSLPLSAQTGKHVPPARQKSLPTLSAQEIFKRVSPSVMAVESLDSIGNIVTFGSGVVVTPPGPPGPRDRDVAEVVTNRHVLEGGSTYRIEQEGKTWPAKLIRVDPDHDLAELSVDGLNAPAVQVRDSSTLDGGEKVFAIGAPEGSELTISEGAISGLWDFANSRIIQTSAAVSPGLSGGGLFDTQGRLVGFTTLYHEEDGYLKFALPSEWAFALNRQPVEAAPSVSKQGPVFQALIRSITGIANFQSGKPEVAVNDYRQALQHLSGPGRASVLALLGIAYVRLGEFSTALSVGEEAVHISPDNEDAWGMLGMAYTRLGQYDKAIAAEREAARLKPDDARPLDMLGAVYFKLKKYDDIITVEKEAIRLKPSDEYAWNNLAAAYIKTKEYDRAIDAAKEAIHLKPDDASAWGNLGSAYAHLGQYDKAASALEQSTRLKSEDALTLKLLGTAYTHLGQYNKAIIAEREAIRLKPDDAGPWDMLGAIYVRTNQYKEAVNSAKEAIHLNPADEYSWMNMANAYVRIKQYDEAIAAAKEAIQLKPDDAFAWYYLGFAYKGKGQQSEVARVYEKLKTLDPKLAEELLRKSVSQ